MMTKLFLDDLRYLYRKLGITYLILALAGVLYRIGAVWSSENHTMFGEFVHGFVVGFLFSIMATVLVLNLVMLGIRYYQTFFGNEAYFYQTLPMKRSDLWIALLGSGLLSLAVSLVLVVGVYWLAAWQPLWSEAWDALLWLFQTDSPSMSGLIVLTGFVFYLELIWIMMLSWFAMSLGYRYQEKPLLKSVLIAVLFYLFVQLILAGILLMAAQISPVLGNFLFSNGFTVFAGDPRALEALWMLLWIAFVYYLVVNGLIGWWILQKVRKGTDLA